MKSDNNKCGEWYWYHTSRSLYGHGEAKNDSFERNWYHGSDYLHNIDTIN